jgi:hypothetical protein
VVASRVDARFCSTRCRQATHRAGIRRAGLEVTAAPLRLTYADPPYPGKSRLYRDQASYGGEVDHDELLSRLVTYDGWALSTSAAALPEVLALAVARRLQARVAAWMRGAPGPRDGSAAQWLGTCRVQPAADCLAVCSAGH